MRVKRSNRVHDAVKVQDGRLVEMGLRNERRHCVGLRVEHAFGSLFNDNSIFFDVVVSV